MRLTVNGREHEVAADPAMPLLWVLRDLLGVKGPKYGCGIAACGACTVHVAGAPVRSCMLPAGEVEGPVLTIEGLAGPDGALHPVQEAWLAHQVPQCGYCQSGQILAAVALLAASPRPTDAEIDAAMTNLCRCGTYPMIRAAIHAAAARMGA